MYNRYRKFLTKICVLALILIIMILAAVSLIKSCYETINGEYYYIGRESLTLFRLKEDDASKLHRFTKIKNLTIYSDELTSLDCIENLDHLRTLSIDLPNCNDLSGIFTCCSLENLIIQRIPADDLTFIENNTSISMMWIHNQELTSLDGIEKLDRLESLYIIAPKLCNIDSIKYLKSLESLSVLSFTNLDYDVLRHTPNLLHLDISGNDHISNQDFIKDMQKLEVLEIQRTNYSDTSSLCECDCLRTVVISKEMASFLDVDELVNCGKEVLIN